MTPRPFVVTSALTVVLVSSLGNQAWAQRPEVQEKACVAGGGQFHRSGPVKHCTTTEVRSTTGPVVSASVSVTMPLCTYHRSCATTLVDYTFTGTSRRTTSVETTTVLSQRGSGAVHRTVSERTIRSAVDPQDCTVTPDPDPSRGPVTAEACSSRGLFTA